MEDYPIILWPQNTEGYNGYEDTTQLQTARKRSWDVNFINDNLMKSFEFSKKPWFG